MAEFVPIARARVTMAIAAKAGDFASCRKANLKSCIMIRAPFSNQMRPGPDLDSGLFKVAGIGLAEPKLWRFHCAIGCKRRSSRYLSRVTEMYEKSGNSPGGTINSLRF